MHSADYVVARCPSVRPSVLHTLVCFTSPAIRDETFGTFGQKIVSSVFRGRLRSATITLTYLGQSRYDVRSGPKAEDEGPSDSESAM